MASCTISFTSSEDVVGHDEKVKRSIKAVKVKHINKHAQKEKKKK